MKNIWIGLLILLCSCESFDTDTNLEVAFVPTSKSGEVELLDHVDDALNEMYPKIGKYNVLNKQKTCVVDFLMGGNRYHVKFNLEGEWLQSEVEIAYEFTLPEKVQEYLTRDEFKGWILIEKRLNQSPDEIKYKFIYKRGEELMSIWLDRNGEVLKDKTDTIQKVN